MTANVNVTKLLFKRGNTVQNANYTGINGEITVDTQAKTLRIHDGVTAGGNVITAGGVVGSYSNTNAAAYIPVDPTITSIQANVAAANAAISAITGIDTSLLANAATQQTQINSLDANITAANATITSLQSNAGVQAIGIDTVNANIGAYQTYANANAATQATSINSINANIGAYQTYANSNAAIQATGIDSINANLGSFQTYANATFGTSNYGNTNVAAYLGAFDGNILPAANITYSLGSEQFQWRDLWVSNNTIYIGNTPLRVDGTTLLVNGAPVSGGTYSNTNVAAYLLGNITTGNIKSGNLAATGNIVTNVRHWDSAGANLYVWLNAANTPELVTLGTFGNIAGWTVSVSDGNSATVTETNPAGYFSISTNVGLTGSGILTFTSPDYQGQTPAPMTISSGSNTWTFGVDGTLGAPGDITAVNFIGDGSQLTGLPDGTAITNGTSTIDIPTAGSNIYVGVDNVGSTEFTVNGINTLNLVSLGNVSATKFTFANGVNILSTVGAAAGNISVGDGRINFVASSSGDGNGFSTIEIRPDDVYTSNQNYLIIDPTAPNHIHIRAGGEQDNSQAELYIGGENSYFKVNNGTNPDVSIAANSYVWTYSTDGNVTFPSGGSIIFDSSATSVIDGISSITFADATTQTTAWTGTVDFGNTIAIGYNTGTVSQGGGAVAIGSTAGNISQGIGAVAVGEAAGTSSQGTEGIAIGKTAGEQSQGAYSIAIGSAAAYYQQRTGAIAIGTSAGALQQGNHAIAIGTGAGSALQGNNSIILNATGSALEQTTDNTFTVKPIRNASGSNVLYYDASTGEITYDTASGGTYGNTEVAAYLPTYTGNVGAARVQVTNAVDFMYGGFPYMGWQLSGSDTLKLRTNIASGDYTNDAVIVDRQSLAVNVVATLSAGNIITTSGVFWSNGTAYSTGSGTYGNTEVAAYLPTYTGNIGAGNVNVTNTVYAANIVTSGTSGNISGVNVISANTFVFAANGVNILSAAGGGTYGNTEVAAYLLTWPNIDSNILDATSANITTLRAANFNSANAVISGGYISALTNASITTATITTLNSTGGNVTTLRVNNFGTANAVITGGYINSLANLSATTAVFTNFSTANAVINGGYISALTNASITTSVVTNFSTANAVITGGYASGLANVTATGNVTAGNLIGYGSNTNIVAGAYTSTFDNVGNVILPNAYVSGNTTVMGIAPGYAPNRPAFRVYGSGVNTTQTTGNVNLKNEVLTVDYNQGNYYDNTTGVFTAPVSGLYNTTLVARVANNNGLNQVAVLRNGNNIGANVVCFWETDTNAGVATHFGTSGTILLNAGEFLSANILAGNISFDGNDSWTVTYLG